ncbi:hypothetical protein ABL78_6289 [Leptomonas seymouri]|uniref:Uncharacterized protein n=1 Tax=Leptomonas seymouri TaxID=5684 RepID=A0A0N1PB32_LEPSE|nr:hypothetical protein ABL78_6289 [Leptomonas seymouri]|eukprot:KPI84648.1 hypothetical protein ABL78_6289 [Leptomonas seymouri]
MLASSPRPDRECSSSESICVDEMGGWASVAEALLMDCSRVTILDVAEPSARQAIVTAYTESLSQLVQEHLTTAAAIHRREMAQEEKQREAMALQLRVAVQESEPMGEQLMTERAMRAAMEEELRVATAELRTVQEEREALRAERVAVWHLLRGALLSASHRRNIVSSANATLEDHVRCLCDCVRDAESERASAATEAVAAAPPAVQVDSTLTSIFQTPRAAYRRILPSTPLNPVTASLLHVKAQVQQLREPSVTQLQLAIGALRPLKEGTATTPPARARAAAAATTCVTPPSAHGSPVLSRSYTPLRSTASVARNGAAGGGISSGSIEAGVAAPPWRTHMAKLQEELKGLRRGLHAVAPR